MSIIFTDYSKERAIVTLNSDLADNLGNLLSRVISPKVNIPSLTIQFHSDLFPLYIKYNDSGRAVEEDYNLLNCLYQLPCTVTQHYSVCEFSLAIEAIMNVLHMVSVIFVRVLCISISTNPFTLVKSGYILNESLIHNTLKSIILNIYIRPLALNGILCRNATMHMCFIW